MYAIHILSYTQCMINQKYRIAHLGLLHKVLVYQRIIELSRTDGHSWNQAAKTLNSEYVYSFFLLAVARIFLDVTHQVILSSQSI